MTVAALERDLRDLLGWFDDGTLIRPGSAPDLVDLVQAMTLLCSGSRDSRPAVSALAQQIGCHDHFVFIIVDGLGDSLIPRAPAGGFLRSHRRGQLLSVFPSTTAAALSSIGTGLHPAEHGLLGWYVWLGDANLTATVLPFTERFSGCDLQGMGVVPRCLFPVESRVPLVPRRVSAVTCQEFADSVYTQWVHGGTRVRGYRSMEQGAGLVVDEVLSSREPSYTSWYLPQVDKLCHERGVLDSAIDAIVHEVDGLLCSLAERLGERARIVVTADHGHVDVRPDRVVFVDEEGPLARHLVTAPTGEPTVPMFHVRPGHHEAFVEAFRAEAGQVFRLIARKDVENLRLLGPRPLSPWAKERCGDYLGLAPRPAIVLWRPAGHDTAILRGVHAGLTPEEMHVPLIVA